MLELWFARYTAEVSQPRVSAAWWSVVAMFFVHGLIVATWVSRIPGIKAELRLSDFILGLTLLSAALGAVCSIPLAGWLVNRFGSKSITTWSSVAFCVALALCGWAFSTVTLAAALFVYGSTSATMDVAMNAQGVEVERELGRPTMSRFHAMFSLGAMIGAGAGGYIATLQIRPALHFTGGAAFYMLACLAVAPLMLGTHEMLPQGEHRLPLNKIPRVLLVLSAISFCALLSEGAMADWAAVYLRQVLLTGPGTAAAGYAAFSAAMTIFRLAGDIITERLGAVKTVCFGSIVGGCGLLWALAMHSAAWALPGFAATGAGFSVIIPLVFGSGGRVKNVSPGAGIATVTGIGYIGFIVGPPTIGFVSQLVGLRYALLIVAGCCVCSALLSGSVRSGAGPASLATLEELY